MDILEKARVLALAIKNSPEYKNYLSVKAEVEQSPEAYDMLRAYRAHQLAVGLAEFANGDVDAAIDELDDLCMEMEENELLSRYVALAPREEFADILDAIDRFVYFESRKV